MSLKLPALLAIMLLSACHRAGGPGSPDGALPPDAGEEDGALPPTEDGALPPTMDGGLSDGAIRPPADGDLVDGIAFESVAGFPAYLSGAISVVDVTGDGLPDVVGPNHWDHTVGVLAGDGHGGLAAQQDSHVGIVQPEPFALGDFDGDGDLDEIVGNQNLVGNNFEWRKNDGTGHFVDPTPLSFPNRVGLFVGDFDKDAKPDLVVLSGSTIDVYLGAGGNVFTATPKHSQFALDSSPLQFADFDGDGQLDVGYVHSTWTSYDVNLCPGLGDGSFGACITTAGGSTSGYAGGTAMDLTGDGKSDLLVGTAGTLKLFRGAASGGFVADATVLPGGTTALAAGDFDEDGDVDLAANVPNVGLAIYANQAGVFTRTASYAMDAYRVTPVDLDHDGHLDLVANGGFQVSVVRGRGDGTFRGAPALTGEPYMGAAFVVDLNKDGLPDLIAAGASSQAFPTNLYVALGDGAGRYTELAKSPWSAGLSLTRLVDVDGDGNPDAVARDAANAVHLRLGLGDGSFAAETPPPAGAWFGTSGDLDGDGALDAIRINAAYDGIELRRAATGTWAPVVSDSGHSLISCKAGDIDGDGKLDLVVVDTVNGDNDDLVFYRGRGDGSFESALRSPGGSIWQLELSDVDGDGDKDVISIGANGLALHKANGASAFASTTLIDTGGFQYARDLALADFDRDGKIDIVYATGVGCVVLRGDGQGNYAIAYRFWSDPVDQIRVADFEGDGRMDILGGGSGTSWRARNLSR